MMEKSNYMVTLSYTVVKTETYLITDETKEAAVYIAENQNQNKQYKCSLWNETESDVEFHETIAKEVSFQKTEDGKDYYWKDVGEKNDK